MTPQAAAALRCPVCGGALMPLGTSLRCPQGHSYDMAKEGYVNLLAIQKRHAADPGDGKAMVRARRAFLQAGTALGGKGIIHHAVITAFAAAGI